MTVYKTHLAILKNGRLDRFACGRKIEAQLGTNDFTLDAEKVTCLNCQNAVVKPAPAKKALTSKYVMRRTGSNIWDTATKGDVIYYSADKDVLVKLASGEIVVSATGNLEFKLNT